MVSAIMGVRGYIGVSFGVADESHRRLAAFATAAAAPGSEFFWFRVFEVDRMWLIWGSDSIPKAIFYLLKGDHRFRAFSVHRVQGFRVWGHGTLAESS